MSTMKNEKLASNKKCNCPGKVSKRAKRISMFLIPKANQDWLLYK